MHQQVPTPVGLHGNAAPQRMHLASKGAFSLVSARSRLDPGMPPVLGGLGVRDRTDEGLGLVYVTALGRHARCVGRVDLQRTGQGTRKRDTLDGNDLAV